MAMGARRSIPRRTRKQASEAVEKFIAKDWVRLVAIAVQSLETLFLARAQKDYTEEAGQALAIAHVAIAFLAGERFGDAGTPDRVRKMAAVLDPTPKGSEKSRLLRMVDFAAERWGKKDRPWNDSARLLASFTNRPASFDVNELARRLENHYVPQKSGRIPRDKWTTAQIAEWLTGDHEVARHASRTGKRKK